MASVITAPSGFSAPLPPDPTLDGVIAIVSAWTIVASVVFHGATVKWLSTGEALALVALTLRGLTYNELREQKAVQVAEASMGESLRAAA